MKFLLERVKNIIFQGFISYGLSKLTFQNHTTIVHWNESGTTCKWYLNDGNSKEKFFEYRAPPGGNHKRMCQISFFLHYILIFEFS